jgi:hypothetical protein
MDKITLVPNTGHEINETMAQQFYKQIELIINPPLIKTLSLPPISETHKNTIIWIHGIN